MLVNNGLISHLMHGGNSETEPQKMVITLKYDSEKKVPSCAYVSNGGNISE
jgi:hypothetical protein